MHALPLSRPSRPALAALAALLLAAAPARATMFAKDVLLIGVDCYDDDVLANLTHNYQVQGYTRIEKNLNAGCALTSDKIYLFVRWEESPDVNFDYITGFYIKRGASGVNDTLSFDGRNYQIVPYTGDEHFRSQKGDLNSHCGENSDSIHLYYTRDLFPDERTVSDVYFDDKSSGALGANGGTDGGYDLNKNAGGEYIYMHCGTTPAGKTVHLETFNVERTILDGMTLTGTRQSGTRIRIADGATVTLDGATIAEGGGYGPGINCLGDATIVLVGTNRVAGGNGAGIYVPNDKTLTIRGTGSLEVSGNYFSSAIGGDGNMSGGRSSGNIVIEGGNITAYGGPSAAAIGASGQNAQGLTSQCGSVTISGGSVTAIGGTYGTGIGAGGNGTCGNITITGGTVVARGDANGKPAPGIGCGWNGSCGDITISGGTVTAVKSGDALHSIGTRADNGTCGTVTIGGVETGPIAQNPIAYSAVDTTAYTALFDRNDGTGTTIAVPFSAGTPQRIPTNSFVREGAVFAGWNGAADGSGTVYDVGQYVILANTTIYAQWTFFSYGISYDLDHGYWPSGASHPESYTADDEITLGEPTRTGYDFAGWTWPGQETPVRPATIPRCSTGDRSFTAHWTRTPWAALEDRLNQGGTVTLTNDVAATSHDTYLTVRTSVTLDLAGHTLTGRGGTDAVHIGSLSSFTLTNSVEGSGGIAGWGWRGVYVYGSFTMFGGTISNRSVPSAGTGDNCAVYVFDRGTFTMNGGEISGNAAQNGGAVYVKDGATFEMNGGRIEGNSASSDGGAVYVEEGGTLAMNGGTVSGNVAGGNGGGVYLAGAMAVSGAPAVFGNTNAVGAANDVYLTTNATIAVASPSDGARIGVRTQTAPASGSPVRFAYGATADDRWRFFADDPVYEVRATAEGLVLALPCWADLQAFLDAGGTVTLGADYAAAAGDVYLVVTNEVVLDLNGHTVAFNGSKEAIHVTTGGVLTLTNRVEGSGAVTGGGDHGVYVGSNAVFRLQAGAISGNFTGYGGGGVFVNEYGAFEMTGGAIADNIATNHAGGGVFVYKGSFTMSGGTISGNPAGFGGGVYVGDGAIFTMNGGTIADNSASGGDGGGGVRLNGGGGVYVALGGSFAMAGGAVSGNSTDENGGGVKASFGGAFTMAGGTVSGNSADLGGGVDVEVLGQFALKGGAITDNTAQDGGGGVYVDANGAFAMSGEFSVSGSPVVAGNACTNFAGAASNVHLADGATIAAGGLAAGASVGVTTATAPSAFGSPVAVATGVSAGEAAFFASDRPGYVLEAGEDGVLRLRQPLTWAVLQDRLDRGGRIRLPDDCAAAEDDWALFVTNDVTLDLNGHTLVGSTNGGPVLRIDGGRLLLTNSAPASGAVTGCAGVYVGGDGESSGEFILAGGAIAGCGVDCWSGAAVFVDDGCSFTMSGGTICSNAAEYGAGVYLYGGSFAMSGGAISDNEARRGGGVYVEYGSFAMSGGVISGNAAAGMGGGVYLEDGSFEMSGGVISGNAAVDEGGGVYEEEYGAFTMNGGEIAGNKAGYGAGVFVSAGVFELDGGAITGNVAVVGYDDYGYEYGGAGGGVFVCGPETTVSGAPVVSGNTNDVGAASNVYLWDGVCLGVGSLAAGASIGVTADPAPTREDPVVIADGATEGDVAYFFSDSLSYGVEFVNGELCLVFGGVFPEYVYDADDVVKANWLAWAARTGAGTNAAYEAAFLLDLAPAELDAPTGALLRVSAIVPTAAGCRLELASGIRGLFQPAGKAGACYLCNGVLALEFADNLEDLETGWAALRLVDATVEDGKAVVDFVFYDGEPAPDALFLRPSIRSSVPQD